MEQMKNMAPGIQGFECENKSMDLFFSILNFKPRCSYYLSVEDKLSHIEELINTLSKDEIIALTWYTSAKLGMRLAPTIIASKLAIDKSLTLEQKDKLKFLIEESFTTPKFIANSLSYLRHRHNVKMKNIPSFLKKAFKRQLESYKDITLKKNKLKQFEYSLSDMIKVFRPNPTISKSSNDTYKQIIENSKEVSLKNETVTSVLSNDDMSYEKKQAIIQENLSTMPINEIIRNISNINVTDENYNIISKRLYGIIKNDNAIRFLNPYDLVILNQSNIDYRWLQLFDDVLIEFMTTNVGTFTKDFDFLIDISGSMMGSGQESCAKFLSLLRIVCEPKNVYFYGSKLYTHEKIENKFKTINRPNVLIKSIVDDLNSVSNHCTETRKCTLEVLRKSNNNLILVTDEFSYDNATSFTNSIKSELKDRQFILFNTCWSGSGAFSFELNILRATGYQAQIFEIFALLNDFNYFKHKVINAFESKYKIKRKI